MGTASCALAAALFLLTACPAFAADAPKYNKSALGLSGRLLDLALDDMNGDGLKDVVAVSVKGDKPRSATRTVEIFYQKRQGGFPARPDASWRMDASAVVFDTGYADTSGRKSVLYISPDGLYAYLPDGTGYAKRPSRLIKTGSVFTSADPMDMPHVDFASEPGGVPTVLITGMKDLSVYELLGGSFVQVSEPGMPVETTFSRERGPYGTLTVSHRLPSVLVAGYDRQGAGDIVMSWDDNALIYRRKQGGGYGKNPDVAFRPGLLTKSGDDAMEGASLHHADLDGDGRLDVAVTKKTGGIAHTRSLVFIYMRSPGGGLPQKPTHTIITEGVVGPKFVDLNGDGRADILLPSVKVGVSNFVNMLTSGRVNVDVDIYMQDAKGGFGDRPTKTKQVGFKLDLSNLSKVVPVIETGRFSKGGGFGLAVVSDDDRVSVYLPDRYSILSDRPGVELKADAPDGMEITDLNGDGADDFVMTYGKSAGRAGAVNVFVSDTR